MNSEQRKMGSNGSNRGEPSLKTLKNSETKMGDMSEKVVCDACRIKWDLIRRTEDEVYRMKKHPKIYSKTIPMLEKDLERYYELVRRCREKNHSDTMY